MVQDIFPHVYHNEFERRDAAESDFLIVFQYDKALLKLENGTLSLPRIRDFGDLTAADCRSLFRIDDEWYSMPRETVTQAPEGYEWYGMRQYRDFRPMETLFPLAVGGSLTRWYDDNRRCGHCGEALRDSETERALICPECGRIRYPKICPAVIVAVRSGEKLLLTKYAGRAFTNYALIAGFAEIGEPIEETVRREVFEEVGVRVKNLQFYKSQPWVFTDTLLMGFFCDLDGDDHITLQESELALGVWVDRAELPEDTTHLSLTAEMIEQFRLGLA